MGMFFPHSTLTHTHTHTHTHKKKSSHKLESSDEFYGSIVERVESQDSQKSSSQESQNLKVRIGEKVKNQNSK